MGVIPPRWIKKKRYLSPALWYTGYYSVCLLLEGGGEKEREIRQGQFNCDVQLPEVPCPLWPVLSQTSFPWPGWAWFPHGFLSGSSSAQCVLLNGILFIPFPLINLPFRSP